MRYLITSCDNDQCKFVLFKININKPVHSKYSYAMVKIAEK